MNDFCIQYSLFSIPYSVVPSSGDLHLPLLRRSCVTQPRVARAASYPGFRIPTADVPRRGSVIRISRMTQPFQGTTNIDLSSQGSPHSRATLGYVTQSLRDKGRCTPNQTWNYGSSWPGRDGQERPSLAPFKCWPPTDASSSQTHRPLFRGVPSHRTDDRVRLR